MLKNLENVETEKSNWQISKQTNLTLNDALREMVKTYMKQFPSLTLNAFSKRTNVPGTTLRRLLKDDGNSKNQECAPHIVLNLCSYIFKEKRISHLLECVPGIVGDYLRKNFDQFIFSKESSDHLLNLNLESVLKDEVNYILYKLGANKCGTTRDEIQQVLGSIGINRLEKFLIQGLFIEDHQTQTFHSVEKNFSLSLPLAKKHAHSLLDFYKETEVAQGLNLFYSLSEGLTLEGIKKVKEIEKEAVKKIHEVMGQGIYHGTIPYYALVLSETFLPQLNKNSVREFPNYPQGVLQ